MGFFSSRKAEDNDSYQVAIGLGGTTTEKASVVQVIRSRFYGKKGKEREDQPISYLSGVAAAQALSPPHIPVASTPLPSSPLRREAAPERSRAYEDRALPPTPSSTKNRSNGKTVSTLGIRTDDSIASSSHKQAENSGSPTSLSPRKNTDPVTATLAQRLNELALANSEGLLNDDEYRLLRQNLFERFASSTAVPIETPVVPVSPARPRLKKNGTAPSVRPLSNFQVETRPASISSKTSATSGVGSLFRRATGRRSNDTSDAASVWSASSNTSFFKLPRALSKKSSNSSLQTNTSRMQSDSISISSPRRNGSVRDHQMSTAPRSAAGSIRRMAAPPSSFNNRAVGQDNRITNSIYNVFDEEHLTTVKDIMQEILNVEAECKRLMDAFNGLEVTTLAKSQRRQHPVRPALKPDSGSNGNAESHWGVESDSRSQRRINIADDTISMRSGTSSVAPSLARSAYSNRKARTKVTPMNSPIGVITTNSRPGSLHRKNSASSVSSERRAGKAGAAPPMPALPSSMSHGHFKGANNSNISLVRSTGNPPMNTVHEDDKSSTGHTLRMDAEEYETELEDIRARREEVSQRYEARLEYLRAKLKGAQLHEKLMRK
ncbi:hypothetical protein JR316_0007141 [Psilocybe cubensis]|uniref:Uncharacterized protein n=2 Tax=Psilocybe cubensis TaxID=181762 RepID=A0A8H7XTD0_PSICU|nr:hypothetical protein JR316_0007141 [Psilocybe cubensis]KAH9480541.1 hypothetical protein JR316_0007141 [Psilocybe cubensis]